MVIASFVIQLLALVPPLIFQTIIGKVLVEASDTLVYTVHVSLDRASLTVDGVPAALVPGLAVKADMRTGQRRIIDYLPAPLADFRHDSLRERRGARPA